ncbi:15-hydroxyprostaglandin dehydrogenase [nad(+)] [Holotrichia oblita]|uniref:15-hydroxyprostaglandin dehydrogenase [nad(+)] n=2 Tax=Holotrichia oblita TaxID=644536 RepID=A0ACB9TX65_HOLOL|nr:15-hydroxyprostaglandin dehydrogenase [nad(+)] [Holotrichia oblita]KAI4471367.1 15-hydroxyprostaglandin dehydrogenase [nad(+)] [Holotrichia oblita]
MKFKFDSCNFQAATIADVDPSKGDQALKEIAQEFGPNKAIFVKTDVTVQKEVEAAFKKTIEVFKNLDIVINNAGILNDAIWEKQIAINVNGTVYGCLLAWDYLQKYRSGNEGVIVNIASITGLTSFMSIPVYAATKHAVVGLSKSMGVKEHYDRTKIRVLTICPGVTDTPLISDFVTSYCLPAFEATYKVDLPKWPKQK